MKNSKNFPMGGLIYFGVYGVKLLKTKQKTIRIASIQKIDYLSLKIKTTFPDINFSFYKNICCRLMRYKVVT